MSKIQSKSLPDVTSSRATEPKTTRLVSGDPCEAKAAVSPARRCWVAFTRCPNCLPIRPKPHLKLKEFGRRTKRHGNLHGTTKPDGTPSRLVVNARPHAPIRAKTDG